MAINTTSERVLGLSAAAGEIDRLRRASTDPEFGRPGRRRTNVSTLYRWSTSGCRGVVLETIQVGATRCTSREALQRFFERLSTRSGTPAPDRAAAARLRRSEAAGRALELRGA